MTVYKTRKIGDIRGGQSKYFYGEVMGGGGARIRGTPVKVKGVKKKAKDKDKTPDKVETSQDLLDKAYIKKFGPPPKAPPKVKAKAPPKVKSKKDEFYLKKRKENPAAGPTHMKPSATKKVKKEVKKEVKKKVKKEDRPPTPAYEDMSLTKKLSYGAGAVVVAGAGMVATKKAQDANKVKPKSDFITTMRTAIDSSKREVEQRNRERTFRAKVQLLTPLKEVRVPDTRAKKTGNRPTTGESGDGPGPTPKSAMRKSQIRDFKKYNKSNLLGRSIDDALRGFFSFMGTLPKSTDEDKWKNKR
jgi:hypothetical protein